MSHKVQYAKYGKKGTASLRNAPDGEAIQPLVWGDEVHIREGDELAGIPAAPKGWVYADGRGETGWIRQSELQDEALLDVTFVDVGQGDACLISTPENPRRHIVVDAGETPNMYGFLYWRFGKAPWFAGFDCAVITHGDSDHWGGLKSIFADKRGLFPADKPAFPVIYHNGIVSDEDPGADPHCTCGLACTISDLDRNWKRGNYLSALRGGVRSGRLPDVRMVYAEPGRTTYLPGYDSSPVRIEVLSPVPVQTSGGLALPCYGETKKDGGFVPDYGRTKNGNSVALKLTFDKTSLLLCGDLHEEAQDYLLQRYGASAQNRWQSDVTKWGHHGSHDFSEEFLKTVNPFVTVISSGDDESHFHPRPDTLGAIGKCSRGTRPAIFSTELARATSAGRAALSKGSKDELSVGRRVAVYGAINLRTDGDRLIMFQKNEEKDTWSICRFERTQDDLRIHW